MKKVPKIFVNNLSKINNNKEVFYSYKDNDFEYEKENNTRDKYIKMAPTVKAITTEDKIPEIITIAFPVLMYSLRLANDNVGSFHITKVATASDDPNNSKTNDTVVDVGNPRALNVFKSITSVNITATKRTIMFSNENIPGWNTPFLATSIIPFDVSTPIIIPTAATVRITFLLATFEPRAELRKLTASLLTPTTRSRIASTAKMTTITVKIGLITIFKLTF